MPIFHFSAWCLRAWLLRAGPFVDGHLTSLVPGAVPDGPRGRRTGRSGRSGARSRTSRCRSAAFRDVLPAGSPQQDTTRRGSKGDASLSARSRGSRAPCGGGVRGSAADARHVCDGHAGCSGSAGRRGAAIAAAPSRRRPASSICCRGRSGGREPPHDNSGRRRTSGRYSSSQRPRRTR